MPSLLLLTRGWVYSHHCFLQPLTSNIRGKKKWDKISNICGVSQQHHCCACNLHPNSSVHLQGGKRFCLGHKYVTAQGIKLESAVSWQLRLKKTSIHWKASIWRHNQCSPDSFKRILVLTEVGWDHVGVLEDLLAPLKERSQFDLSWVKLSVPCNTDNIIISTRYWVMEKLTALKDHFSVLFFFLQRFIDTNMKTSFFHQKWFSSWAPPVGHTPGSSA